MALPTIAVTPGSGATINTLPNAPALTASSVSVALATDQGPVPILGRPSSPSIAVTVSAATTYAAGKCFGAPFSIAGCFDAADLSGMLQKVLVQNNATTGNTTGFYLVLFNAQPSGGFVDNAVPVYAAADFTKLIDIVLVNALGNGNPLGTAIGIALNNTVGSYELGVATNCWAQLINISQITTGAAGATNLVQVSLTIAKG